jgi:hypothetical protein
MNNPLPCISRFRGAMISKFEIRGDIELLMVGFLNSLGGMCIKKQGVDWQQPTPFCFTDRITDAGFSNG